MPSISDLVEVNPKRQLPAGFSVDEEASFIPMGDVSEEGAWVSRQVRPLKDMLAGFTPFLEGDVLFAKITPCMENGKGTHATGLMNGIGFGSTEFHVLRARPNISPRFVFHLSQSKRLRSAAEAYMIGSAGQQRVQKQFFAKYQLCVLPFAEQKKIAQILDTLDTQIHQTEALISKLERIKQGLLTDLLTRGIDQNGQLRPTPDQAPQLYKDSPLGWIPKEWEVDSLGGVSEKSAIGPFGSDLVADDYQSEGVPVVFVRDVKASGFRWLSEVYVSTQKARSLAAHQVLPGDVLLSKMGLPPCVACLYPKRMPSGIITADIIRFRPNTSRVLGEWVTEFVNSEFVLRQVRAITAGVTRPKVTLGDARNIFVGVPPLSEQSRVLKLVSSAVKELDAYRRQREQLEMTKQGLMDDLLTGRVRVTRLLEAKEWATA